MGMRDLEVLELVGRGNFASVYKVRRKTDGKVFALKRIKMSAMSSTEVTDALNEVSLLSNVSHRHIIAMEDAVWDEKRMELHIVMEYAGGGDVNDLIERQQMADEYIEEDGLWDYIRQISEGLKCLHDSKIFHRDLKTQNLFMTEAEEIKIGDFNSSKVLKSDEELATSFKGTPYYMSPEVLAGEPYDSKCDIWSLGCVIYELASLRRPFKATSLKELGALVRSGEYERIPAHYSDGLWTLTRRCLTIDPAGRPSTEEILEMVSKMAADGKEDDVSSSLPAAIGEDDDALLADELGALDAGDDGLDDAPSVGGPMLPRAPTPGRRPSSPYCWSPAGPRSRASSPAMKRPPSPGLGGRPASPGLGSVGSVGRGGLGGGIGGGIGRPASPGLAAAAIGRRPASPGPMMPGMRRAGGLGGGLGGGGSGGGGSILPRIPGAKPIGGPGRGAASARLAAALDAAKDDADDDVFVMKRKPGRMRAF